MTNTRMVLQIFYYYSSEIWFHPVQMRSLSSLDNKHLLLLLYWSQLMTVIKTRTNGELLAHPTANRRLIIDLSTHFDNITRRDSACSMQLFSQSMNASTQPHVYAANLRTPWSSIIFPRF